MTSFFVFCVPKIGGGGFLLPEFCPKILNTLKLGQFWGIFACCGLVQQNSAAHHRTCYRGLSPEYLLFFGFSRLKKGMRGFLPPERSPKPLITLEFGLFWGIFFGAWGLPPGEHNTKAA